MTRSLYLAPLASAAVLCSALAASVTAQTVAHADDAGDPVLRYSIIHDAIGDGPSMEIHGDGRVAVHYPTGMKRGGDYVLQLSRDEVAAMLNDFASAGLLDVDPSALRAEMRRQTQEEQVARKRPDGIQELATVYEVSDISTTVIEMSVVRGQGAAAENVRKVIRWSDLQHDGRRFQHIPAVRAVADAEKRLTAIMERAD